MSNSIPASQSQPQPLEVPQLEKNNRQNHVVATIGAVGGIAIGLILASGNIPKGLGVLATGSGAGAATTYFAVDYRATQRRNQLKSQLNRVSKEFQQQRQEMDRLVRDRSQLMADLSQLQQQLLQVNELSAMQQAQMEQSLKASGDRLKLALQAQAKALSEASHLAEQVGSLQRQIQELEGDRSELLEQLQSMIEGSEAEVHERVIAEVATQVRALREGEIRKVVSEYEAIGDRFWQLFAQFQVWGGKVKESHDAKSSIISGLASEYSTKIGEFQKQIGSETDAYLKQIEILRERLAVAYAVNAGEIRSAVQKDFGYSAEGAIVNEIAVWVQSKLNIPLAVKGFHLKESGVVEAGYGYSSNANPAPIVEAIAQAREQCARNLGIYKIESVKKLEITDCLSITFRRDRPVARAQKGSLYRSQEDFIKLLMSSRLFFRFVGSPGSGKTPSVMVVLSHLLKRGFLSGNVPEGRKLSHIAIDFCNPLEDISVKNSASEMAIFHRWSEPKQALKDLKAEYEFRREPGNKAYRENVGYVWVCDEFDNAIAEIKPAELKGFMKSLKDGGHVNMGAIVMGQSVMASSSNFKIEDQKFLLNVLLDPVAIRTFLEQYGEKFYAPKAIEVALANLEQIELELEEANESIADTARQLRVAMVVAERSPVFYQLPYFDSVDIDISAYADTRKTIAEIRSGQVVSLAAVAKEIEAEMLSESGFSSATDAARRLPMLASVPEVCRPVCPHCGSNKVRSKGDKWLCEDAAHSDRSAGKPKSWHK